MTFKVVRNDAGVVVAFGPDTNNYAPTIKAGEFLTVENTAPVMPKTATETAREAKLTGVEILGVMCSATKEDQNGMIAIGFDKLTNTLAGTQMGSNTMEFENGSKLVITDENFSKVYALWRPFRKSFF